jgi:hypothetical protein
VRLKVQHVPESLFDTLEIVERQGYQPTLSDVVTPVVVLPYYGAAAQLVDAAVSEFFRYHRVAAGGAATFAESQLWNLGPVNITVRRLLANGVVSGEWDLYDATAELATNVGNGHSRTMPQAAAAVAGNINSATPAAAVGTLVLRHRANNSGENVEILAARGLIIPPGRGLTLHTPVANAAMDATWEWDED